MRNITLLVAALITAVTAAAQTATPTTDYQRQSEKAARFFDNSEWLNASAMYTLMLAERPTEASTYAHAIVARYMEADTLGAVQMLVSAMDHQVPFDDLLADVRTVSMGAGSGTLYEDMLFRAREQYPWMGRSIDRQLLDYYDFRDNGPRIVQYANTLLEATPDSREYLMLLARGHLLSGQGDSAANVWKHVIHLYPDYRDALLYLASYYRTTNRADQALPLLRRAQELRATPYVATLLRPHRH